MDAYALIFTIAVLVVMAFVAWYVQREVNDSVCRGQHIEARRPQTLG